MSGLALMVMALLGVTIGNTDGGILDLLIFGIMQGTATKWYLVIPVGIIWFAIYFFVFRWYILKHDIKTPGREDDDITENVKAEKPSGNKKALSTIQNSFFLLWEEKKISTHWTTVSPAYA